MDHADLIYTCTDPECLKEEGVEALTEERGDRVHVQCGLCGRRRDYPKEALNRESTTLVTESLRGYFKVAKRYDS